MKKIPTTRLAITGFVLAFLMYLNSGVNAQQPDEASMRKWMEYMTPGESHHLLASRVGKWNLSIKMWMEPGQPASEMQATSDIQMIMGGRYLVEKVQGEFEGAPFEGQNTTAFDNGTKKFISTWIDNMATGMMLAEGTYDSEKKEFHYSTQFTDPMTHKPSKGRTIDRIVDESTWVMQSFKHAPDGKEFMDMEITYRRANQ